MQWDILRDIGAGGNNFKDSTTCRKFQCLNQL